ncbi:IS30 family transposase [Actinoplanes xinjiangensis]|uniref:IS30 family transposase n=1 Tax=Actinoplanes xinjiangensis TaxID=512350 RepID=A0A316DY50_9ACTN|nr:IS30 family transposase [Actinoplanes xinjiangensis]PWK22159.1 IS30 family transposase [Actinoplanes xinjiangensis]GIF45458.1 IS30 family transposase [Actinoplanes xinjiangensis]
MSLDVKRRYFELIRTGMRGARAAAAVGVSLSCGSLWFIDAGSVSIVETPISGRYFSQDDRIEIADGLERGERVKVIAARIGKSYQSVYREIARNRKADGRYQPWYAHNQAHLRRRRPKVRRLAADPALREAVAAKLRRGWSPVQISRWLRRRYSRRRGWQVCAETIYEAVYRGVVLQADPANLRTGRTYRRRRGRGRSRDGALKQSTNMKSIRERPAAVESRRQAGHWEGDLIVGAGQRSAVATLVERKTRFTVLVKLVGDHSAQTVGDALIAAFAKLPAPLKRTLTWDQGNEMFHHERIEHATGLRVFFADPHSPWQRGTNENTNGLLRQYLPKGTDLSRWTDDQLREICAELNERPRLCLNDKSPSQLMRQWQRQPATS